MRVRARRDFGKDLSNCWRGRRRYRAPAKIASVMNLPDFIESKREEIREIAYRHGARNVRLFGSMVRGQGRENSDVDLLVDVGPRTTAWFPAGMIVDLEDLLGRGVDVVAEAALHPMLRENVLREAVSL